MSAPERIWAFHAPEVGEDNPQCSIVAGEHVMHGAQQYVRADKYIALKEAADELAEAALELQAALSEAKEGQDVNYGESALARYREASQ